jgi:hypothetical protein
MASKADGDLGRVGDGVISLAPPTSLARIILVTEKDDRTIE